MADNSNSGGEYTIESLLKLVENLTAMLAAAQKESADLKKQLAETIKRMEKSEKEAKLERQKLLNLLYGKKTEKSKVILDNTQMTLFDMDYPEAPEESVQDQKEYTVRRKKKKTDKRSQDLEHLPHKQVVIKATPEQKKCPNCGTEMDFIGQVLVRKELVVEEPEVYVKEIYVESYICRNCTDENGNSVVVRTEAETPAISHSFTSAESIAHVISERFIKGVPYYRQVREWLSYGIEMSRRTLCNWVLKSAENLFKPIWQLMRAELLGQSYIHADETHLTVMDERKGRRYSKAYMWVYTSIAESDHPVRLFDYEPGRGGKYPGEFLDGFSVVLITDAYSGCNKVTEARRACCWAHCRRKMVEVLPDRKDLSEDLIPVQAIRRIQKIFLIEKKINSMSAEEKKAIRIQKTKPLVDEYFSWIKKVLEENGFSSAKLKTALEYNLNHEKELRMFLTDGNIPCTNSLCERTIRSFAIGRKNFLFSSSRRGAEMNGVMYSIIETAKANRLDPRKYIVHVLKTLPQKGANLTEEILKEFLPWNPGLLEICQ